MAHIDANGHDASSRSAASDVLRYFDIAAPHHHEDEERHVFPAVLATGDARMQAHVAQLKADHARMSTLWGQLRLVLESWRDADPAPAVADSDRALVRNFVHCYADHIPLEETLVYPAAQGLLDAVRQVEIGAEMAARRRQ